MNFQYKLYQLETGHTIVTPHGEPITGEEFNKYFSIISKWLEDERPDSFKKIQPSAANQNTYGSMVSKMFKAIVSDPYGEGLHQRYLLEKRTLAFLFVISYYIQKENRERTNPFLNHVMGHALLEWMPLPNLVEHYLGLSAENGGDCKDAVLLCEIFGDCPRYRRWGFERNPDKALKYAEIARRSPFYDRCAVEVDFAYAKALFCEDEENAEKSMSIVRETINGIFEKLADDEAPAEYLCWEYLELGFEMCSKRRLHKGDFDLLLAAYDQVIEEPDPRLYICGCKYWLAQCYINGINNQKDVSKAIGLLCSFHNPDYIKKAGLSLAKLYLEGNGVPKDISEARAIASLALLQRGEHPYFDEGPERSEAEALKRILSQVM